MSFDEKMLRASASKILEEGGMPEYPEALKNKVGDLLFAALDETKPLSVAAGVKLFLL
jgi:hypothetical protein